MIFFVFKPFRNYRVLPPAIFGKISELTFNKNNRANKLNLVKYLLTH